MPKPYIIVALVLSMLGLIYSLLGVAMAYWVAGVPGNTPEHIRLNFIVWVSASVAMLGLIVFLASRLLRRGE